MLSINNLNKLTDISNQLHGVFTFSSEVVVPVFYDFDYPAYLFNVYLLGPRVILVLFKGL